jgi:hypothetical protein
MNVTGHDAIKTAAKSTRKARVAKARGMNEKHFLYLF